MKSCNIAKRCDKTDPRDSTADSAITDISTVSFVVAADNYFIGSSKSHN